ncbi:MAG: response regulator [Chitinophagaceae bacterium]|nr:MAG: response regulator [Chitinophagaceae bacterium]
MSSKGPIVIIEDDEDDQEFYSSTLSTLGIANEVMYFDAAEPAYKFLEDTSTQPFLIICDINLPGMSGIEFKKKIYENPYLRHKSIPFIFLSTSSNKNSVTEAYNMMVQGYFVKPNSVKELTTLIEQIISYWKVCKHPNSD